MSGVSAYLSADEKINIISISLICNSIVITRTCKQRWIKINCDAFRNVSWPVTLHTKVRANSLNYNFFFLLNPYYWVRSARYIPGMFTAVCWWSQWANHTGNLMKIFVMATENFSLSIVAKYTICDCFFLPYFQLYVHLSIVFFFYNCKTSYLV